MKFSCERIGLFERASDLVLVQQSDLNVGMGRVFKMCLDLKQGF